MIYNFFNIRRMASFELTLTVIGEDHLTVQIEETIRLHPDHGFFVLQLQDASGDERLDILGEGQRGFIQQIHHLNLILLKSLIGWKFFNKRFIVAELNAAVIIVLAELRHNEITHNLSTIHGIK